MAAFMVWFEVRGYVPWAGLRVWETPLPSFSSFAGPNSCCVPVSSFGFRFSVFGFRVFGSAYTATGYVSPGHPG